MLKGKYHDILQVFTTLMTSVSPRARLFDAILLDFNDITLFRVITMLCGTDNIMRNIPRI